MSGLRVHLELTNRCNLSCAFCPKHVMTRRKGYMNKDLAMHIMDELSAGHIKTERLFFHLMGEPLLHPDLIALVRYATDNNLPLSLYTNASLLTPDTIRLILDAEPLELIISVQTPDEATFKLRKDSLDYNQFLNTNRNIILAKKKNSIIR